MNRLFLLIATLFLLHMSAFALQTNTFRVRMFTVKNYNGTDYVFFKTHDESGPERSLYFEADGSALADYWMSILLVASYKSLDYGTRDNLFLRAVIDENAPLVDGHVLVTSLAGGFDRFNSL